MLYLHNKLIILLLHKVAIVWVASFVEVNFVILL